MKLNGNKVKILAGYQGMSVSDLARKIGRTPANLSHVLRGGTYCRTVTACLIARALGVEVEEILLPEETGETR